MAQVTIDHRRILTRHRVPVKYLVCFSRSLSLSSLRTISLYFPNRTDDSLFPYLLLRSITESQIGVQSSIAVLPNPINFRARVVFPLESLGRNYFLDRSRVPGRRAIGARGMGIDYLFHLVGRSGGGRDQSGYRLDTHLIPFVIVSTLFFWGYDEK